jgi:dihydroneopterin aldolase
MAANTLSGAEIPMTPISWNDLHLFNRGTRRRTFMSTSPKQVSRREGVEARDTWRVIIRNLVLPARVGVYRHEQLAPQQVRINIELTTEDPPRPLNDEIRNVVSYEEVVLSVKEVLVRGHINLVETLAEAITDLCLSDTRVVGARVGIEKLHAIPEAESVGVEIERLRSNH